LLEQDTVTRLLIVGYSYGSIVAVAAATAVPEAVGFVAINPPLDVAWALFLFNGHQLLDQGKKTPLPKLLIHATRDQFCSNESFDAFVDALPDVKLAVNVQGANHFDVVRHLPDAIRRFLRHAFDCDLQRFAKGDFHRPPPSQVVVEEGN